jgi:hypothetical protein
MVTQDHDPRRAIAVFKTDGVLTEVDCGIQTGGVPQPQLAGRAMPISGGVHN